MKPPICEICDKKLDPKEGGLVYFSKRPKDVEWDKKAAQPGFTGHPPYAAWFCGKHFYKEKELEHLTITDALKELKSQDK